MKCDEIFAALAMLEKERGIPQSFMMGKIIQALTTAYKRDHEGVENVIVDVDEEKKDLKMYVQKDIVEEVENPASQISLEEAKRISAKNELGGVVNFPVESVEFGRIAAGNGKQVIIQGLREAEHGMIYDEWGSKQHEILTGTVSRIDPRTGNITLRIGTGTEATDAILTLNEQVPGEELKEGQMVKVYLVEVRRSTRGPQVLISRTHPGLVKRLFELEVPEIFDGTVEIRSIAREAGNRTKMAVYSADENIDPMARVSALAASASTPSWRSCGARRSTSSNTAMTPPSSSPRPSPRRRSSASSWVTRARFAASPCRTTSSAWPSARRGRTPAWPPGSPAIRSTSRPPATPANNHTREEAAAVQKPRKIPQRQCVGCREMKDKKALLRIVKTPEGDILLDATGKKSGRGAYVCPDPACLKKARKSRALERAFDTAIPAEVYDALEGQMGAL